ncbi:MAG: trypsin-like peptidase domain-containing protein, partial [Pseudoflavonifractor sp.]
MYYSDYNNPPEEQPITTDFRLVPDAPPKKKKHIWHKVTALCLTCALLGGLAGVGTTMLLGGRLGAGTTTLYAGEHAPTVVSVSNITAKAPLTLPQIYATYVGSTVGITVETVTTNVFGQTVPAAAAGSGFVVSVDGYILTNYHVIDGASSIKVAFKDGKTYDAVLIGGEKENDVAVLKIEATGLTPVVIGDSDNLVVGEQVAAIG